LALAEELFPVFLFESRDAVETRAFPAIIDAVLGLLLTFAAPGGDGNRVERVVLFHALLLTVRHSRCRSMLTTFTGRLRAGTRRSFASFPPA
jgi:hypothetical protein